MQPLDPKMPPLTDEYLQQAARADHAGGQPRGVCGAARYRLRVRNSEPRQVPRQRVRRSQGPRRGVPRHPDQDPHRREARPVAAHPEPVQAEQGARARDRPDGLGQVDDAVRDDRLHQPHARRAHHHDRGSDRVRAPEPEVPDQSARGAHAHQLVQGRAPRGAARGSGHPAGRRAARSGDRGDRDRDRRDRASRLRHSPHDDGRVDGRPHHRSVSVRSAVADPHHAVGIAARRHRADAVPEDRRRPRGGARGADRERRREQPDPRGQDVPDPVDDAGEQGDRHGEPERRADGSRRRRSSSRPTKRTRKSVDKDGFEALLKRCGIDPKALARRASWPSGQPSIVRIVRRRSLRIARSGGTRGAR